MGLRLGAVGRRERAKEDKHRRVEGAARVLFAERGFGAVTTQQVADRAGIAIGTLYLYVSTKAELLIMVQNQKFAAAIDDGLRAVDEAADGCGGTVEAVLTLVGPVVACIREHPENGRIYLHELVFGDPAEPYRRDGLALSLRLEEGLTRILEHDPTLGRPVAVALARVVTAIVHVTSTAAGQLDADALGVLRDVRRQVSAVLGSASAAV